MFEIYEKTIHDPFYGKNIECLVAQKGVIVAHVRGWSESWIMENWSGPLKGTPISARGEGWNRLGKDARLNAQAWAADIVETTR